MAAMWTTELEEILISSYQNFENLWNPKHRDYHKKGLREAMLRQIAEELGGNFIVEQIKLKIKYLRDQFSREHRKVADRLKSGACADNIYISKWEHFNSLQFLKENYVPRSSTCNLTLEEPSLDVELEKNTFENDFVQAMSNSNSNDQTPVPRKKKRSEESTRIALIESAVEKLSSISSNKITTNYAFGRYVGCMLNELPKEKQNIVRMQIQKILFDAADNKEN